MDKSIINALIVVLLVIIGISTRFLFLIDGESILPNFSAVGAVAIFGACYFKGVSKWIIPLAILWVSDLILNNVFYAQYYESFQVVGNLWVYLSFIVAGLIAYKIMRKPSWGRLAITGISAGVVFFLISNFGVWMSGTMYPMTSAGLIACFEAGIPFFRNTVLGNVFYSFVLVGLYEYVFAPMLSIKGFRMLSPTT